MGSLSFGERGPLSRQPQPPARGNAQQPAEARAFEVRGRAAVGHMAQGVAQVGPDPLLLQGAEGALHTVVPAQFFAQEIKQGVSQQALVSANQRYFELADKRYNQGVDSYLTRLDAQRSLFSAQQSLISTRLALLGNEVSLYKAIGGGWQE